MLEKKTLSTNNLSEQDGQFHTDWKNRFRIFSDIDEYAERGNAYELCLGKDSDMDTCAFVEDVLELRPPGAVGRTVDVDDSTSYSLPHELDSPRNV